MANLAPFTPNTLVQFRLDRVVKDPVINAKKTENFEATLERKLGLVGTPDPVVHVNRDRIKATGLLKLLQSKGLELVEIESEIRSGKGGVSYFLLTFKFGTKPPDRSRRKALADGGMKLLESFLGKPWKRGMFSTFPKEPETCSMHFSGEIEEGDIGKAVADVEAAKFGLTAYEEKPKENTGGTT